MIRHAKFDQFASIRRWLPPDLYLWLKAALLALIAVQAVRLLWAIITPVGPFGDWRPAAPRTLSAEAQSAVLSSVDIFMIWTLILLVIGFSTLSRLSRAKSAAIVISLWLVTVVIKVGLAALGALRMKKA